jgi:hypothetical protein
MMKRKRTLLIWLVAAAALLPLLLLASVQVFAPTVLNRPDVKSRIESLLSREIGAAITIERIDASLLPSLYAGVSGVTLSAQGTAEGTIGSLTAFPKFLPLLIGRLKVEEVRVVAPDFSIQLSKEPVPGAPRAVKETTFTGDVEAVLGPVLGPVISGPGLVLNIEKGRLDLVERGRSVFLIRNINARFLFASPEPAAVSSSALIAGTAYAGSPPWQFRLISEISGLEADSPLLPGSVRLSSGPVEVLHDQLTFVDLRIEAPKTTLALSGSIHGYQRKIDSMYLSADGKMDPTFSRWIAKLAGLHRDVTIVPSLTLEKFRFAMDRKNDLITVQGTVTGDRGGTMIVDLSNSRAGLNVRRFSLKDRATDATLSLSVQDRIVQLSFNGTIAKASLDRLLSFREFPNGEVRGNFRARILLDRPGESTAQGTLTGANIFFPATLSLPLSFERISLNAQNNVVAVETTLRALGRSRRVSAQGTVALAESDIRMDLDVSGDLLDLNIFQKKKEADGAEPGEENTPEKKATSPMPPLSGTVRVRAREAVYQQYTAKPLGADITFSHDGLRIDLPDAVVCGVSAKGYYVLNEGRAGLDLSFSAADKPFQPLVRCVMGQDVLMTGTVSLTANVSAAAEPDQLLRNLRGSVKAAAANGRVDYGKGFARVLDFLNVTEVFRGKFKDLREEGLQYTSFTVTARFEKDRLLIDESVFDGATLDMAANGSVDLGRKEFDLVVLVSPLKTGNDIIQALPVIRDIFGGTLVTIPVKVTGSIDDPKVTYHPVKDIGSGLLGMMKRTVQAPFKLIDPDRPGSGVEKTVE